MNSTQILKSKSHRSRPLPTNAWRFYQEWNDVIFLHYKVDLIKLQQFVPKEITVDLFDNEAWISIVVFRMENVRPRFLPPFKPFSNFEEINIRTYVKHNGVSGVYFLSIEAEKLLPCILAKSISELPYRHSNISRKNQKITSNNKKFSESINFDYRIGKSLEEKSALEIWLTERYALFQDSGKFINTYDIHHIEWPVQEVEINNLIINYPRFSKLLNNNPNLVQYSKGVEVIAWGKNKIPR